MASQGSFERTILEDPVATACFNLDGTVRLWNPAAERLFGFSAAEALGHRPPTIPGAEFSSAFPDQGPSSDDVLAAADKALYRAKAEGRDRVAVAVGHQAQGSASTGA